MKTTERKSKYQEKKARNAALCKLYRLPEGMPYPIIQKHLGRRLPERITKHK